MVRIICAGLAINEIRVSLLRRILGLVLFVIAGAQFVSAQVPQTDHTVPVASGWNLLSLPASVTNGMKDSLFPTSVSRAFTYLNGYRAKDTLEAGIGFWLKFDSPESLQVSVTPIRGLQWNTRERRTTQ